MKVTREDIDRLTAVGLQVVPEDTWTLMEPGGVDKASGDADEGGIPMYPCYRTVEEIFDTATALADDHPNLVEWLDVGDSWEKTDELISDKDGFDMRVLRLTNRAIGGNRTVLFVTAVMHAREYATVELVTPSPNTWRRNTAAMRT